jgi:hypothetical protein
MLAISCDAGPCDRFVTRRTDFLTLGLDPPGFKLRAASGFEAADFFVAGTVAY